MRLQKNKSSSSFLIALIFVFSILIGFGVFRIIPFKPIQLFNESIQCFFGKTSMLISREGITIRNRFISFFSAPSQYKKIQTLEYEIRKKNIEIALYKNYAFENDRLKTFLKLFDEKKLKVITGDILFRDPIQPMNFTINKGKIDFIKIEKAVVYPLYEDSNTIFKYQLVGRIQELDSYTSKVLSILDEKSKISGRNLRNESIGNVIYNAKMNVLYLFTPNENDDFKVGDVIVTSSFSTLPKNLIIGIVQKIETSSSINKKVILATSVDLLKINLIAVVQ